MNWTKFILLGLALATLNHVEDVEAARILGLFPMAAKSHFVMAEALLKGLAARGHEVDVVSHFPLKNPLKNYRDISIAGAAPIPVNNVTLDLAENFASNAINAIVQFAGDPVCEFLELPQFKSILESRASGRPYDVVIVEMFVSDCYLAFGRHLDVPMVGLVTSKLFDWMNRPLGNPPSLAFVPSIFSGFGQRMSFLERLHNTLFSDITTLQYWYRTRAQIQVVKKFFGRDLTSMVDLYGDLALVLVNTHPSLDSIKPMTPAIVEVAGLHVTEGNQDLSPEVKKWLDESKDGCIYFSFGSMVKIESFPKKTIDTFYETFERIAPVRVLLKIANKDELPAGLPKNVMTYPWLPQTRVLKHKNVKAFVTHGGLMSNHEAVTYGVPMVSVPIFGDQHLNARFNEKNHIGLTVDYKTVTADSFTATLKKILDKSYSEKVKLLSKRFTDRPLSAMDTAVFWVEYVIRNGNILRSPASDLTWWQVELLDVYGFLIAILLLALYLIKRVLGLALRLAFSKSGRQEAAKSKAASKSKKNK